MRIDRLGLNRSPDAFDHAPSAVDLTRVDDDGMDVKFGDLFFVKTAKASRNGLPPSSCLRHLPKSAQTRNLMEIEKLTTFIP
jgi:hypothetical protein